MHRVLQAARLHFVHPLIGLAMPWLIVGLSFVINLAVWHLTPAGAEDGGFTGGILALYITMMIGYVQTVTQLLPLAMGMSLSRRSFYLGTVLVAVVEALIYGTGVSALTSIEDATSGWGVDMGFWAPGLMDVDNPALQVLVSGTPVLLSAFLGIGLGVVSKRWGPSGVWGLTIAATVVVGGLAILVTWLDAWRAIGNWFADQSVTTLAVGLPAALAVAVAAASFAGIRRVVP
ncbi:hypothetical protein E4P40_25175 [Blastococcus sp. CT_GayMR20]|uniref:hypothetical protein n=1 Tax=Blastococcus sp. CT_GayMR20 TaxID=2559609 RepID=UPI001073CB68|nr:hypothetical protein [Blastococcus sp. CT_GayMR20]TFV66638.1 hypothetical protein E4P40_25175 [Blastococcus sp. CT_GayMR20]